jgi:hypothetical protein
MKGFLCIDCIFFFPEAKREQFSIGVQIDELCEILINTTKTFGVTDTP